MKLDMPCLLYVWRGVVWCGVVFVMFPLW